MIKQDYLAGKLSARHHIPHLVAEPLRLLARRGVVVQALLDHPVPGGGGDNYFVFFFSFSLVVQALLDHPVSGVVVIIIMMMAVMMLMLTFWQLKEDPCY